VCAHGVRNANNSSRSHEKKSPPAPKDGSRSLGPTVCLGHSALIALMKQGVEQANPDKKHKEKKRGERIEARINPTQIHQRTTAGHENR